MNILLLTLGLIFARSSAFAQTDALTKIVIHPNAGATTIGNTQVSCETDAAVESVCEVVYSDNDPNTLKKLKNKGYTFEDENSFDGYYVTRDKKEVARFSQTWSGETARMARHAQAVDDCRALQANGSCKCGF